MFGRSPDHRDPGGPGRTPAGDVARIQGGGLVQVIVSSVAPMTYAVFLNGHAIPQIDVESLSVTIEAPAELMRYIAPKGSVALDGISLTVNEVEDTRFGVNLIPYTLAHTNLGDAAPGQRMNLEIDPIARYVARLFGPRADERTSG